MDDEMAAKPILQLVKIKAIISKEQNAFLASTENN